MTSSSSPQIQAHWDMLAGEVPADLKGSRVLHVGGGDDDPSLAALGDRGADLVRWRHPDEHQGTDTPFDLVYCSDALQLDPHPSKLLSDVWHAIAPGGVLLLESQIEPELELSRFGRFVVDSEAGTSYWVPGRLTLRWLVETSGFDVDRWLGDPVSPPDQPSRVSAYLRATKTDRMPALDLAHPG